MNRNAPIVIFAYNRADKLKKLLESLEKNSDIKNMDVFIFVDVPQKSNQRDVQNNKDVITFINKYVSVCDKFNEIHVEIANDHKGLANSIISGVSKVINQYGKVIVLEDDLMVSDDFLDYMQRGLEFYKNDRKVWSVGAHCPDLKSLNHYSKDVFLFPRVVSLGWGTWKNRWNQVDWNVSTYKKFKKDVIGRFIFNLGGNDLSKTLDKQIADSSYDSWAIRWSYQQFLQRKYTVYPKESRVVHCGNDSRSTHGAYYSTQKIKKMYKRCEFQTLLFNWEIARELRKYYSTPLRIKILNLIEEIS